MFSDKDYELWCRRNKIKGETRILLDKIRKSDPVRLVRGSGSSVTGQFPSQLMGSTRQFESHRCELRYIQKIEHEKGVKEYYDQPFTYRIAIKTKSGREAHVSYTPDFLVIHEDYVEFVECKTEEELIRLAKEKPDSYHCDDNGVWRSPPAEEYPRKLDIRHTIVSTANINPIYIRNLEFFDDYLRAESLPVSEEARQHVVSLVSSHRGITLDKLLKTILNAEQPVADADDVYMLMVRGEIFVNLYAEPLAERERVLVFENEILAEAYSPSCRMPLAPRPEYVEIAEKTRVLWDGKTWEIVNIGEEFIWLVGEKGDWKCSPERFDEYLQKGLVEVVGSQVETDPYSLGLEILNNAPPHVRAEADRRLELIRPYLSGEKRLRGAKKERSKARYKARYQEAEALYGIGLVGLLPHWPDRGNRKKRLLEAVLQIMDRRIQEDYETNVQKNITIVWGAVLNDCEARDIPEKQRPSYSTFYQRVVNRPIGEQTTKRKGKRAGYKYETFIYWIDKDTPPHGDRPFHIVHIDHTKLDIELLCSITGEKFGRPWASFMVDAYSRRLLAIVVTYDPPSYRTCMMLFRECVRRHGRLPQILVLDRGNEHDNLYIRRFAGAFQMTLKWRPAAKPRHGSPCERLFGSSNKQFTHNLLGNTQIMTEIRKVTKAVDPKEHAVWTIREFTQWFLAWGYHFYDKRPHWTLKQSPLAYYARGVVLTGARRRQVRFNETLRILTMPYGHRMTAKVDVDGCVKVNYIRYQNNELRSPNFVGKRLLVRYDPHDLSTAYVHTGQRWLKCRSEHFATFEYMTEKQLEFITKEIRKKDADLTRARSITARSLADFITSAERFQTTLAEKRLLLQRAKDYEVSALFRVINGLSQEIVEIGQPKPQAQTLPAEDANQPIQEVSPFAAINLNKIGRLKELV